MGYMHQVRCTVQDGLMEWEKVAIIPTADGGSEAVTVASELAGSNTIEAAVIGTENGKVLIELPRESASGRWRLWVPASIVS
jgi:hypothetical protein